MFKLRYFESLFQALGKLSNSVARCFSTSQDYAQNFALLKSFGQKASSAEKTVSEVRNFRDTIKASAPNEICWDKLHEGIAEKSFY